jgi:nucleoside-triphosphatase THEP1
MELAGKIVILSGWRGAGKTSLCRRLVEIARARGWSVAGLLSPGRFDGDHKIGIDVEDLASGERHLLAIPNPDYQPGALKGGWLFDDAWLSWGNHVLASVASVDLLVVDELGPLEFDQGRGWTAGLEALDRGLFRRAIVVIRPELLERARLRWPGAQVTQVDGVDRTGVMAQQLILQMSA